MSELNAVIGDDGVALVSPSPETAGAMLRAAREKAGLHVAALAVSIKIPVKKLEALEADELLGTHDLVFTRALAASVCRTLKIDAALVLAALPQTVVRELHVDDNGINAPFLTRASGHAKTTKELMSQPSVALVIALCVGALVIAMTGWWEPNEEQLVAAPSASFPDDSVVAQATPVVIPAPAPVDVKPSALTGGADGAQTPTVISALSVSAPVVASAMSVAAPIPTALVEPKTASTNGTQGLAASDSVMSFKARQQAVWVQVVDAKGEVQLRRNIAAGERVVCGGALPLVVVIGRADSVEVEVRGKAFDFSAFARDNVARFEVK